QIIKTAWLRRVAGVVVPIARWRRRIIELPIPPMMALGVPIHIREIRKLPMIISRVMIDRLRIHIYPKHRPAQTIGKNFPEDEDHRVRPVMCRPPEDTVTAFVW